MWMDWQQTTLTPGLNPVFTGLVRTPPEARDPAAIKTGDGVASAAFQVLDAHLKGRKHMLGENFTVADIPIGAATYRWYALPITRPELPNLFAWYQRLQQRPAYRTHVMLPLT
jgi:glutathione S-transferase